MYAIILLKYGRISLFLSKDKGTADNVSGRAGSVSGWDTV